MVPNKAVLMQQLGHRFMGVPTEVRVIKGSAFFISPLSAKKFETIRPEKEIWNGDQEVASRLQGAIDVRQKTLRIGNVLQKV